MRTRFNVNSVEVQRLFAAWDRCKARMKETNKPLSSLRTQTHMGTKIQHIDKNERTPEQNEQNQEA